MNDRSGWRVNERSGQRVNERSGRRVNERRDQQTQESLTSLSLVLVILPSTPFLVTLYKESEWNLNLEWNS